MVNEKTPQEENYDSTADTLLHIKKVSQFLMGASKELLRRAAIHDDSKLGENEKPYFDRLTPILKHIEYGSEEYKKSLAELKPALEHHYKNNSHHPEHYPDGLNGMDLFDIVELFFDWKAATERMKNGDIQKSLDIAKGRFGLSDQLHSIMTNTVNRYPNL